jgi:hypothetical protein
VDPASASTSQTEEIEMVNIESQDLQEIIVSQPSASKDVSIKAKDVKSKEARPVKSKGKNAIKKPSQIDVLFQDIEAEAGLPSPRHLSRLESRVQELVLQMTHDVAIVNPHSHRGELTPRVPSEVTDLVEQMQKARRMRFIRSTLCMVTVVTLVLSMFVLPTVVATVLRSKGLAGWQKEVLRPTLPMP